MDFTKAQSIFETSRKRKLTFAQVGQHHGPTSDVRNRSWVSPGLPPVIAERNNRYLFSICGLALNPHTDDFPVVQVTRESDSCPIPMIMCVMFKVRMPGEVEGMVAENYRHRPVTVRRKKSKSHEFDGATSTDASAVVCVEGSV